MLLSLGRKKGWTCAACAGVNPQDGEFCVFCGRPRRQSAARELSALIPRLPRSTVKCPACGHECGRDERFCTSCGANLAKPAPPTVPVQEIAPEAPRQEPMVQCVHCGGMNPERNRVCSVCSRELRVPEPPPVQEAQQSAVPDFCPECGARNDGESLFCSGCGSRMTVGR